MFDSILFDFDGVLADTEPVHYACWREVLAGFDIDLTWPYYAQECIGVADRVMLDRLGAMCQPVIPVDQLWPSYAHKQRLFREKMKAAPPFLEDTLDLIRKLQPILKLAEVSSSHRSEIEPPLLRAGVLPLFQALVCGNEVPNLKPAPDPYLRAAELLHARRPLVIEDSDAGEASERAAGFEVLRLSRPEILSQVLKRRLSISG